MNNPRHQKLIFFDGVCNLCNSTIDLIIRRDRKRLFRYVPLQSALAKEYLPEMASEQVDQFNTIIYYDNGEVYYRSEAILRIFSHLKGVYAASGIFLMLPAWLRDAAYNLIAKNRYRLFGKKETCRLPTAEEKSLFLL